MFLKIYLALVGLLYIGLAMWCSFSPAVTSEKVGFELKGGSGQSEFLTVYGGLEFGLGLIFILSILQQETLAYGLIACLVIHISLAVFRTAGFAVYSDIGSMTYKLAIGEWIIVALGLVLWFTNRPIAN